MTARRAIETIGCFYDKAEQTTGHNRFHPPDSRSSILYHTPVDPGLVAVGHRVCGGHRAAPPPPPGEVADSGSGASSRQIDGVGAHKVTMPATRSTAMLGTLSPFPSSHDSAMVLRNKGALS